MLLIVHYHPPREEWTETKHRLHWSGTCDILLPNALLSMKYKRGRGEWGAEDTPSLSLSLCKCKHEKGLQACESHASTVSVVMLVVVVHTGEMRWEIRSKPELEIKLKPFSYISATLKWICT